jgi:arsenate reductase
MKTVIFACVHNAGRSQMAAAWLNALAERAAPGVPPQVRALSAGTSPAAHVHPEVLEVMKEVGIDLSGAKPQKLTASLAGNADLLVTMGCGDRCPYVPGLAIEDWPVEDPKGQPLDRVRDIRDQIRRRVEQLLSRR